MPTANQVNEFAEFCKQYGETSIQVQELPEDKKFFSVYVDGAAGPDNLLQVRHTNRGLLRIAYPSKKYMWQLDLPTRGLFNYQNHVGLYYRMPKRQWKRGLCSGNSAINWLTATWRHCLNPSIFQDIPLTDLNLVGAIYDRYFRTKSEIIEDLFAGRKTEEAFNEKFAVSLSPFSEETHILLLWYETQLIGDLTATDIEVRHEPFLQEVIQYFGQGNRKWQVRYTPVSAT